MTHGARPLLGGEARPLALGTLRDRAHQRHGAGPLGIGDYWSEAPFGERLRPMNIRTPRLCSLSIILLTGALALSACPAKGKKKDPPTTPKVNTAAPKPKPLPPPGTIAATAAMLERHGRLFTPTRLATLEDLFLTDLPITDADLAYLAPLSKLRTLMLKGTKVGDKGVATLSPLKQLRSLNLQGTAVTGSGLAKLTGFDQLRSLSLAETAFDDAGAAVMPVFKALEALLLNNTKLTDAGLDKLPVQPALQQLSLAATAITDASVVGLARIPSLRQVWLTDTKVTKTGLQKLKETLLTCKFSFGTAAAPQRL